MLSSAGGRGAFLGVGRGALMCEGRSRRPGTGDRAGSDRPPRGTTGRERERRLRQGQRAARGWWEGTAQKRDRGKFGRLSASQRNRNGDCVRCWKWILLVLLVEERKDGLACVRRALLGSHRAIATGIVS